MAPRDRWIETRADGSEGMRLFCFPYAGGGSPIYRGWQDHLPPEIGLYAVQLPGRGTRIGEPAFPSMASLIPVLETALAPYLDRPFALFGHSMGAIIAYEAARHLRGADGRGALHLFVSARRAPGMKARRPPADAMSDEAFVQRLRELGGTPEEVLREPDLMALFMPMLRADFRLNDTYVPLPGPPLACPVTVFGGRADSEALEHELLGWGDVCRREFDLRMFPGAHHFLQHVRRDLLAEVVRRLGPLRVR